MFGRFTYTADYVVPSSNALIEYFNFQFINNTSSCKIRTIEFIHSIRKSMLEGLCYKRCGHPLYREDFEYQHTPRSISSLTLRQSASIAETTILLTQYYTAGTDLRSKKCRWRISFMKSRDCAQFLLLAQYNIFILHMPILHLI